MDPQLIKSTIAAEGVLVVLKAGPLAASSYRPYTGRCQNYGPFWGSRIRHLTFRGPKREP